MGHAELIACRLHLVVLTQFTIGISPDILFIVTCRTQAVGAVFNRTAAGLLQRTLQPAGKGSITFPALDQRNRAPSTA